MANNDVDCRLFNPNRNAIPNEMALVYDEMLSSLNAVSMISALMVSSFCAFAICKAAKQIESNAF